MLLVDEFFATEDDRFLAELRKLHKIEALVGLAERWKKDPRPWAREQIVKLLELPLDVPGHQPVVKRLFKQAEARRPRVDGGIPAGLRSAGAVGRDVHRYDWQTRQSVNRRAAPSAAQRDLLADHGHEESRAPAKRS